MSAHLSLWVYTPFQGVPQEMAGMSVLLANQLLSNGECQQEGLLVLCLEQSGCHSLDWTCTEDDFFTSGG